jgi:regulator of nucleoside diphosphate kinase
LPPENENHNFSLADDQAPLGGVIQHHGCAGRMRRITIMQGTKIIITQTDYGRLRQIIERSRDLPSKDAEHLDALEHELESAIIARAADVSHDLVTMKSRVRVLDLGSGRELVYQIVFPGEADLARNRISVLAPIGMALLGRPAGAVVEWQVPSGMRRLLILEVEYQPEAAKAAA